MSKNNKKHSSIGARQLNRALIIIVAVAVAAIAVTGVIYSIYAKDYNGRNHAEDLSGDEVYQLNYTLTVFGRNASVIGSNDVLILETSTKELGGDTQLTFLIYRYTSESELNAALRMTAQEIAADGRFECVGDGTVTMVDDQVSGMQNMKTTYTK